MKKEEYKKKDGSTGFSYKLEVGDKIVSKYDSPRVFGEYNKFSLGCTHDKEGEIFVSLTKAQGEKLQKIGQLQNKIIEAYEYENQYGKQVGVKVL